MPTTDQYAELVEEAGYECYCAQLTYDKRVPPQTTCFYCRATKAITELQARVRELDGWKADLNLIANGKPGELYTWAETHNVESKILTDFERYRPNWFATAEYRGAVVYILREIARNALREA